MELLSKESARLQGLKRFFTGEPCKNGHIAERYVSGGSGCVQCMLQYSKDWYSKHPGHYATKAAKRRKEKPEAYKATYDKWVSDNYDQKLTQNRGYRARRMNAPGSHTSTEAGFLLACQNYKCEVCDANLTAVEKHLDHINPLVHGGSDELSNLQWLCGHCNRSKKDRPMDEFILSL